MIWVTADLHFGHKNIIKYCKRPFKTISDMDWKIIGNWNSIVNPDDTVYILGDFALTKKNRATDYLNLLTGKKILLIGNHDRHFLQREFKSQKLQHFRDMGFKEVYDKMIIFNHMILVHVPIFIEGKITLNVGVDKWNFYPIPMPSDKNLILCGHVHEKWIAKVRY